MFFLLITSSVEGRAPTWDMVSIHTVLSSLALAKQTLCTCITTRYAMCCICLFLFSERPYIFKVIIITVFGLSFSPWEMSENIVLRTNRAPALVGLTASRTRHTTYVSIIIPGCWFSERSSNNISTLNAANKISKATTDGGSSAPVGHGIDTSSNWQLGA